VQKTNENEVIEFVRFGIGIKLKVTAKNGGIILEENGYVWKWGNLLIPLPVRFLLGKAYIEEMPLSNIEFCMKMEIRHPIFGTTFQYNGNFLII
jgi:hypothetical protein